MHRTDAPGATVDNKFTDGDPVGGVQSTMVDAAWLNDVQENIMAVLVAAGVAPTKGRAADLLDSIKKTTPGRLLRTTIYINNAGILQASVDGGAFANVGATFTPQSLTRLVHVIGLGAGGAGAGSASTSAGSFSSGGRGGSAGGISEGIYSEGFSGVPVAVGLGGVGVNGATGGNGGSTSFGALLSVPGGPGGAIVLNTPIGAGLYTPPNAASAVPTGGKIYNGAGNPGGQFTSFGQDTFISGAGASTIFGAGGEAKNSSQAPANSGVNGGNGLGYGSGGSGAGSKSSNPSLFKGGDGVGGLLIVKEHS